jgi:hypothetical protein
MSKHQASRRRNYGRRRHQLHERPDRTRVGLESPDEQATSDNEQGWNHTSRAHLGAAAWSQSQGI